MECSLLSRKFANHRCKQLIFIRLKSSSWNQSQPQPLHRMAYAHPNNQAAPTWQNGSNYRSAVSIPNLGMSAAPVDCPMCGQRAMTSIIYFVGNTTQFVLKYHSCSEYTTNICQNSAWALAVFCLTLCLCFIPYMMNSLKDVKHKCGNCGTLLATWHKSGAVDVHCHA